MLNYQRVNQGLVNVPWLWDFEHHYNKYLLEMKSPQYLGDVQLGHLPTPVNGLWNTHTHIYRIDLYKEHMGFRWI
jgi:hypothetical protein